MNNAQARQSRKHFLLLKRILQTPWIWIFLKEKKKKTKNVRPLAPYIVEFDLKINKFDFS